jgi:Tfp pilus assembly protein PilO
MADVLGSLSAQMLAGIMLLVLGLGAVEGWMLLLRKPFAEYRQMHAARAMLGASVQQAPEQAGELGKVVSELKLLRTKLSGQLQVAASDDEMVASLMGALDQSASRYGIFLTSMTPGPRQQVSVFEEVSFGVIGNGNYLQLCRWMLDFEQTLGGSATITDFDMRTTGEGGQVILTFNIAVYRPIHLLEGAHDF